MARETWYLPAGNTCGGTSDSRAAPFRVYRETDAKQLNTQLSNDVRVPVDSLDKFVLTGFAGQLKMCGGPFTPLLRHYGVLLLHLAIGMGLDDTDEEYMMLPFGDGLANW